MAAAKMKAAVGIAAAVLLVGAAVPTAYHYATARPEPEPAAVTVAAAPPLPVGTDMTRPASGSLPPGMTAEPLAIMNVADKRWVGPTGEEFTDMPATVKAQLLRSRMNVQGATHVLLFRVHSPDDATSWTYSVQQVGAMGSTGMYDPATRSNYQLIYFSPPPAAPSVSLTIDAATGPWVSRAVIPATAAAPVTGDIDGVSFTFDPPAEEGNVVRLKRTIPRNAPWGRGLSQSFYALDSAGKKVYFRGSSSDGRTDRYDFPGPLSSYKEFRLDTRSYNYHATYAAVPLPGAKQ